MSRTLVEIDEELRSLVATRHGVRVELAKPDVTGSAMTSFTARIELMNVRIDRLLQERLLRTFEQEVEQEVASL